MFKKIRRTTIARSFTGDSRLLQKLKEQIKSHGGGSRHRRREGKDLGGSASTNTTVDLSSDEADHQQRQTIQWVRAASGKTFMNDENDSNNNNNNNINSRGLSNEQQRRRQSKMRELPSTGAFSSNLILVNRERIHRGKEPLKRCRHLDGIAKKHASEMAHAEALLEDPIRSATMAENVQRGPSIRVIHQMIMVGVSDVERNNILNERFHKFGMGTATGEDGMMYMSQIFQASAQPQRRNSSSH